jgi:hypothetical protein
MNFGTWKASTASCQSRITAACTIRMIAKDRADRPVCSTAIFSSCSVQVYRDAISVSTKWLIVTQPAKLVIASEAKHPTM